jgi:hypothetical protein
MDMSVELQVAKKRQTSMYGLLQQIHNQAIKSTSSKSCVRVIMYIVGRKQNLTKGGRQADLVASYKATHLLLPPPTTSIVSCWVDLPVTSFDSSSSPCHHMLR